MSFANRSAKLSSTEVNAASPEEVVSPKVIGELFRADKVSFTDFAAVLGDLRKTGEKPTTRGIFEALQELSSPHGREARQQRNSVNAGKIVRLPASPGLADPNAEALALRVQTYESQLEEAQREIEQSRHLREDVSNLQRQLERARRREEELNARLRSTEASLRESSTLEEELHRQKTQLQRIQQKEETLRAELKRLQESENISVPLAAESVASESPENVINFGVRPVISERELLLTNELEAALATVDRLESDSREIAELRRFLEEEQNLRQALEARWLSTQERVEQAKTLERELTELKVTFDELLQREQSLQAQFDVVSEHTAYLDGIANEVQVLEAQLARSREHEKGLSVQLEEATRKALLAADLEDQVASLNGLLDEFRDRESEWSHRLEQDHKNQTLLTTLRDQLEAASRVLAEGQERERHYLGQLAEIRQQLAEGAPSSRILELENELAAQTDALAQTTVDLLARTNQVEEIRERLLEAERSVVELRESEAQVASTAERERDLVLRLDQASQRATQAEQELTRHTEMMEWGRERTEQIHLQLREARSVLARLFPEAVLSEDLQAENSAAESSYAASFGMLETLLGQLHRELEQAQQYRSFLQEELDKAQSEPVARPSIGVTIESVELRKCLAETIEIELSRQNAALSDLVHREELLRAQLGKIKPQTQQAQSIQGQLSSQEAYREDLKRREVALTELLRETLISLRAGRPV